MYIKNKSNKIISKLLNNVDDVDIENNNLEENNYEDTIKKINNKIYFYEDVTSRSILFLKKLIHELHFELVTNSIKYNFEPIIELRIHSNGGEVFAGLDAYNFINTYPIEIHTYVDGFLASSASFLYLAGKKRYIYENNYILIHQLSDCNWGSFSILQDEMENNKKIMNKIIDTYKQYTTLPKKTIHNILKNETYLDYQQAFNYGFATDIITQ